MASKKLPWEGVKVPHLSLIISENPGIASQEFSKKNLLALGAKSVPVAKTRGV
jgi:hypothetical protein